jgi:uncharacterized membrane protein YgcG
LEAIAENYNEKTTNQLVTVVIPDKQGRELFDIGMKIFDDNGIGPKNNNGLLLLIAATEKDNTDLPNSTKPRGIRIIV